ncbi:hypothetical protein A3860_36195 [Niastella vici]|uniref:Uncharacterized protein n=1 Tax=Niastella vici TaxID=1703345 RepID=A0A1V9FN97_9BACT|nr:hypothetical protein A3860_36195 [Niastella vici]
MEKKAGVNNLVILGLPVTGCRLPVAGCRLPVAGCQDLNYEQPANNREFRIFLSGNRDPVTGNFK